MPAQRILANLLPVCDRWFCRHKVACRLAREAPPAGGRLPAEGAFLRRSLAMQVQVMVH